MKHEIVPMQFSRQVYVRDLSTGQNVLKDDGTLRTFKNRGDAQKWIDRQEAKAAPAPVELTEDERGLLAWLASEDYSQYGECHGKDLDGLIAKGLAQVHPAGEHQSGFIAQGRGDMYRAVSLTDKGQEEAAKLS